MDYLLKASAVILLFYCCYVFFLQRETFFNANRWFLVCGLVTSVLLPLLVIPIYVETAPIALDGFAVQTTTTANQPEAFDAVTMGMYIYTMGATFFIGRLLVQLLSVLALIQSNRKIYKEGFVFIETTQITAPFSFFKYIIFNPTQFNKEELDLILKHEKVHASQWHSMDVLFMDIMTALFWCNPLLWLYRKSLKQNLEFIADHLTQNQSGSDAHYQKLLLKTSVPENQLLGINTFYNSTIKKRIVMLHKSKSNLMNTWKFSIVIPFLVLFAMTYNTKTIAQNTKTTTSTPTTQDQLNILTFIITKDTKDTQLIYISTELAKQKVIFNTEDVIRNAKNEIMALTINYDYNDSKSNFSQKSSDPIKPIEVTLNPTKKHLKISQQDSKLSQTFNVDKNDAGQPTLSAADSKSEDTGMRVLVNKVNTNAQSQDSVYIENTNSRVTIIDDGDKNISITTVDKTSTTTQNTTYTEQPALIYLDGKEINKQEMDAIDHNTIGSINILKGSKAIEAYGEKAEHGVILITSKKIATGTKNREQPLYILDGKEINKSTMEAINPDTIDSVNVIKDKTATKKYGAKGKDGVIIITSKKTN